MKYDTENEKNKALRHKSGQVFLESLKNGAVSKNSSVKEGGSGTDFFLEDEDSIILMFNEIEVQRRGKLLKRLNDVS
jgi:hypothetical protein